MFKIVVVMALVGHPDAVWTGEFLGHTFADKAACESYVESQDFKKDLEALAEMITRGRSAFFTTKVDCIGPPDKPVI